MVDNDIIDEALEFYNIDLQYREKCYNCIDKINKNKKMSLSFYNVYKMLYEEEFEKIKPLWNIKNIYELFTDNIDSFVTNVMILLGYNYHRRNMKKYNFCPKQVSIHKKRVKECFESDLINRKYNGIRISQMLWAIYFIRIRIIEVGSLQFEYEDDLTVKIHIPKNTNLDIVNVKKSINKSKNEIERTYAISNFKYVCNSWLLSNQIYEILDKNTNISRFHSLFNVSEGEECTMDILNFVYGIDKCDNYSLLSMNTTLQKKVKTELLNGKKFYLGLGVLKT